VAVKPLFFQRSSAKDTQRGCPAVLVPNLVHNDVRYYNLGRSARQVDIVTEPTWSLQDAKNRFSAVVDAAQRGEPQWVTRRGKRVGVVLSAAAFERLQRLEKAAAPSFNELLLELPQDDHPFERVPLRQRDVDF